MHLPTPTIITNLCMLTRGTRVLVLDRNNKDWPGITFPGGHVEDGESFTAAVIREFYEETGLTIDSPRLCGIKDWVNGDASRYMVLLYRACGFTGELRSSDEGRVFWTDIDELPALPLAHDMEALLKVFIRDDISEFFYHREDGGWRYKLL